MEFFNFLMFDVLSEPAVLVGLIALIGLIAQKKPVTECIKGTVKTIMGFVILGAGATLVVNSLGDFATIFQHAFGIKGVVPNNEAIVSIAQQSFGKEMAMIMFFAMLVNILIARLTPWKFIFLTGHHTLFMSMMVAAILSTGGMSGIPLIAVGSLVVGVVNAAAGSALAFFFFRAQMTRTARRVLVAATVLVAGGLIGSLAYWVFCAPVIAFA